MPEAASQRGAPVPPADVLEALPADEWAVVLRHVRAVLHELDDTLLDPRSIRLRSVPAGKLAGGRSRRDLCRLLARGGLLWMRTAERLRDDPVARDALAWLLAGEVPPEAPAPAPTRRLAAGPSDREERLADRVRELVAERDEAVRRAGGLQARLRAEHDRAADLEAEVERLRSRVGDLERSVADAADDREQALQRLRRQHEAQLAGAREELRELRRLEQEREQRRRREEAAREAARREEERAAAEATAQRRRSGGPDARLGRPSRLPAGLTPGTTEAVAALLDAGPRVVVDGYNVTMQHRGTLPLEQQRRWLVGRLGSLVTRRKLDVTVVFDGDPTAGVPAAPVRSAVRVAFTAGQTADDAIVELASSLPPDEPLVVVTDDRELRERLERLDVDVVATTPFLGAAA